MNVLIWLLPAVALLTGLGNALAIGAAAAATAGGTQMVVKAVAHRRPEWAVPVQMLTAGGLLTLADLLLRTLLPDVTETLGVAAPVLLLATFLALLRLPRTLKRWGLFIGLLVLVGGARQLLAIMPPDSFRDPAWLELLPPTSFVIGAGVITLFMLSGGPEHRLPPEKPKAAARGCCQPPGEGTAGSRGVMLDLPGPDRR